MADCEWFFASEYGRDRILKDRLTDLEYQASSATSSSARLSSQLAHLQGSVENRLSALSAAFDAYVELGDVRESLAAYADQTEIRMRATEVVRRLSEQTSGPADRLDDPDRTGYWLVPATNALTALVTSTRDPEAEAAARSADPEADLFLVAAAGAFDRGADVSDLLPALFAGRDRLDASRVLVFRAVVAGHYGPALPALRAGWADLLATDPATDPSTASTTDPSDDASSPGWPGWVQQQAKAADRGAQLQWLDQQAAAAVPDGSSGADGPVPPPARRGPDFSAPERTPGSPVADAELSEPHRELRDELRGIVVEMISAGTGAEADLLRRARVLRARIENPEQARDLEERAADQGSPAVDVIRDALTTAEPGGAARSELFAWVRPALAALVSRWAAEPVEDEPVRRDVRTGGGVIPVGTAGPDLSRLSAARAALSSEDPEQRRRLTAFGTVGAVLLVVAAVVAFTSLTALAILALVGAIVCGVFAFQAYRTRGVQRRQRAEDVERLDRSVDQAVAEVRAVEEKRQAARAEESRLLAQARTSLAG